MYIFRLCLVPISAGGGYVDKIGGREGLGLSSSTTGSDFRDFPRSRYLSEQSARLEIIVGLRLRETTLWYFSLPREILVVGFLFAMYLSLDSVLFFLSLRGKVRRVLGKRGQPLYL